MSQLSKNFSQKELECPDGCGTIPTSEAIKRLQELRDAWGHPIKVNSAARCATHNSKVGGASKSQHMEGNAFDVVPVGGNTWDFIKLAMGLGWHGIGIGSNFVHIDLRADSQKAVWNYPRK